MASLSPALFAEGKHTTARSVADLDRVGARSPKATRCGERTVPLRLVAPDGTGRPARLTAARCANIIHIGITKALKKLRQELKW